MKLAENTNISWCDHTWNPWIGCTKVSPACDGCYAEALMDTRMGRVQWGAPGSGAGTRSRTGKDTWKAPVRWQTKAFTTGNRPFVFCASLADIFDLRVDPSWRRDAFSVMGKCPNLTFLLLTKRPQLIADLSSNAGGLPSNCAIGATIEDQVRADRSMPAFLDARDALERGGTPPLFAFLSCEPLLSSLSLTPWLHRIDWVITGGETSQGTHTARQAQSTWFRDIRDQCAIAGVPYHHKQNGEWLDGVRIGRAKAGRLLDGVEHNARPTFVQPRPSLLA